MSVQAWFWLVFVATFEAAGAAAVILALHGNWWQAILGALAGSLVAIGIILFGAAD